MSKVHEAYGLPAEVYSVKEEDGKFFPQMRGQSLVTAKGEVVSTGSYEAAAEVLRDYVTWNQS